MHWRWGEDPGRVEGVWGWNFHLHLSRRDLWMGILVDEDYGLAVCLLPGVRLDVTPYGPTVPMNLVMNRIERERKQSTFEDSR